MLPHDAPFDSSIYEEVFESTSDLILITDRQGVIVRANRRALQLFPAEATLGTPFWVRLGLDVSSLTEAVDRLSALRDAPGAAGRTYACHTTRNVYDINLVPLGGDSATPRGFLLILNDITCLVTSRAALERRVGERTACLARSQKMLRSVFQGVGKGIILVDEDREVVESNQKACEIFGLHPANILGVDIRSLCSDGGRETILAMMDGIIENQVKSAELTALYFDKRAFPAVFTVSVIIIDGYRLWIVIVDDVSEQKSMERQLKNEKILTEEVNITLRTVLRNIENEQRELTGRLSRAIANDILPMLRRIKAASTDDVHNGYIDFVGELLVSLTKGSEEELDSGLLRLSKTEMKICKFIQAGFGSKEICTMMNLAFDTIQTHRKNIRRKLGLAGSGDISLYGYLMNRKLA
ncbi:PAS domain S-box protein [Geobacter sp. FeAm09]|uniref:PAS domain S-box protein n=1 Tax=Geobacter sp. FeAm09 TaxID=2597769 RepID=UPI00143DB738|nr:PAS domain S-box protein [Geobacter sp. FeAm09]